MSEFDNNQNNPNTPLEGENKPTETEKPVAENSLPEEKESTEETSAQAPETAPESTSETPAESAPEAPKEEPARSEEPYNPYGAPRNDPDRGMYNGQSPYRTPEPPKKKNEIRMSKGGLALLIVCCLAISIFASAGMNNFFNSFAPLDTTTGALETTLGETTLSSSEIETTIATTPKETAPAVSTGSVSGTVASTYSAIAKECIKSVVVINVTETTISYGQEYTTGGAGSGVIYTKDGYIITNYHVVGANTKTISVTLHDGSVYNAKYIYGDEYVDLAVIKIEKNDCDYAIIGDFEQMQLGDEVLAIGNPLGYGLSVTNGIISALERQVTVENTTMTLLQTSAAINSGNSGGGLFNMKGELIGIVNAKVGGTSVEGMGFAIPSTTVIKSLNDLKEHGYITGRARLGLTVSQKTYSTWPYMQTYYYIQISDIDADGSAAKSGIQVGDILQKFNGEEITSFSVLSQQLTKYKVGDTVTLTVRRPTIEQTDDNLADYLNSCAIVDVVITFVEFNPNA